MIWQVFLSIQRKKLQISNFGQIMTRWFDKFLMFIELLNIDFTSLSYKLNDFLFVIWYILSELGNLYFIDVENRGQIAVSPVGPVLSSLT